MFSRVFDCFCALGAILGARGALLGILGSILAALGTLLGALGALLAALGALLGALGALLGALGALLGRSWSHAGFILQKKHRKNQKKSEILEPTWEAKWSQNHEKSMLKASMFSDTFFSQLFWIFFDFGGRISMFF